MKEFNLSAKITISIYTKVEAENLEEAIEIAEQREVEHHQFGDIEQENRSWVNEDYDGEPYDITKE